jgi:hypothetical protein
MRTRKIPSGVLALLLLFGMPVWAGRGTVPGNFYAGIRAARPQQPAAQTPEQMADTKLAATKKITVDTFGEDPVAKQLQAMIINALVATKKFVVTDWPGGTDATLRGAALATTAGGSKAPGETGGGGGGQAPGGGGGAPPRAGGATSIASSDTVADVTIAVRLVASDGSVIWATTKETKGANGKGPIEDSADQIVAQLLSDIAKLPSPK